MQARGEVQGSKAIECHEVWDEARLAAIHAAARLADLEVHKQQANRILEPYVYVKGVMTATEWENFFALRYHADADPEFENLAREIHVAMKGSVPVARRVHLPYATDSEDCDGLDHDEKTMVSAARCARISYRLFDGALSNVAGDLDLCKRLLTSKHMSPFQHLAVADDLVYEDNSDIWAKWQNPQKHERYWGWVPIRFEIERQLGMKSRRSSFEKLRVDPSL